MTASASSRARILRVAMIGSTVLLMIALASFFWWPQRDPNAGLAEQLQWTRAALVRTENGEAQAAAEIWNELFTLASRRKGDPNLPSIALNRALSQTLQVDALAERSTNNNLSEEARQAARQSLPQAVASARQSVADLEAVSQVPVVALWLRSRIELHQAALLPGPLQRSSRLDVFEAVVEAIEEAPERDNGNIAILGGLLSKTVELLQDPVEGLPAELKAEATAAFFRLSDLQPRNLYFALLASRAAIEAENPEAERFVRRTWDLVQAVEPMLATKVRSLGLEPEQLVEDIVEQIENEEWTTANRLMRQWFNAVNATELAKTDRRLSDPHPIDLLSFASLRNLSAKLAAIEIPPAGEAPLQFDAQVLEAEDENAAGVEADFVEPIDFDLDLDSDLASIGENGTLTLWRNDDGLQWAKAGTLQLDIAPRGLVVADLFVVDATNPARLRASSGLDDADGASADDDASPVGDRRHDTFPTLLIYGAEGIRQVAVDGRDATDESERLRLVEKPTGMESVSGTHALVVGDLEGDGDLDVVAATEADGVRIFINRGDRTFFELDSPITEELAPREPISAMAIADLDRDLDLDIVTVTRESGRVGVLENLLHLQFRYRPLQGVPQVERATQIEVAELDGNVSWDLVIGGPDGAAVVFSHTSDVGAWKADEAESIPAGFEALALADFNNDSWDELIAGGPWGAAAFRIAPDVDAASSQLDLSMKAGSLRRADFNRDGRVDLAYVNDSQAYVALNRTEATGHYLRVRFRGIDDNATGRVNHYAIGSVLELRFGPHYRSHIITEPVTHFGLDGYEQASSLRVIFPNGFTQSIRDPEVDTLLEEKQELKGSCPYLYAWNGQEFTFVTDCLWAAPLGLQVASGVVAPDRPWEYLKVDGRHVAPKDGQYELRITEELWEIVYIDHVALRAIDHPDDVDIWTNEKVGPPQIAEPRIYAFGDQQTVAPVAAADTGGRDVTEALLSIDEDYVQGFDRRLRQGLCPPHWIDVDFGKLKPARDEQERLYLVLTGWILPTDTSLNIQIDQNPELPAVEFPSVWVPDETAETGWRKAIPFTGFPGGKTKTIVVDVTDALDREDARLRVRTSAQIYWDAAQLAVQSEPAAVVEHDLRLLSASVQPHGFSQRRDRGPRRPETYDYENASARAKWPPLRGRLTRFGACSDLVEQWDDAMVVMGAGDEVRLRFSVPDKPVPPGWERDFVLHCVGWDKDADLNTLTGQSSDPLPFRDMNAYPPSPLDSGLERVTDLNDHHRNRRQSFRRFWTRPWSGEQQMQ